jgi:hypothetical protein
MDNHELAGIIRRKLQFFKYRVTIDHYQNDPKETILKIQLPLLCYLKVRFFDHHIDARSYLHFGFHFLTLEVNFILYAAGLLALAFFKWDEFPFVIFLFLFILLLHFMVCFIKLETMKNLVFKMVLEEQSIIQ